MHVVNTKIKKIFFFCNSGAFEKRDRIPLFLPCHSEPAEESPNVTSKSSYFKGMFRLRSRFAQHDTKNAIVQGDGNFAITSFQHDRF